MLVAFDAFVCSAMACKRALLLHATRKAATYYHRAITELPCPLWHNRWQEVSFVRHWCERLLSWHAVLPAGIISKEDINCMFGGYGTVGAGAGGVQLR